MRFSGPIFGHVLAVLFGKNPDKANVATPLLIFVNPLQLIYTLFPFCIMLYYNYEILTLSNNIRWLLQTR
jgi:hypothetical protein